MRVMSRIPLLLALVVIVLGVGLPVRVMPTGAATMHAPAAAPANGVPGTPAPPVVTSVSVSPSPTFVTNPTTIAATTLPNALCTVQVQLPNGSFEQNANLIPQGASASGSVQWIYPPSGAAVGLDVAIVTCSIPGFDESGQGTASFLVLPLGPTATPTGSPIATVIPGVPQLAVVGPSQLLPGAIFSLNGAGFTPGAVVSFTAFTLLESYQATVGMSGTFTISNIMVPYSQVAGPVVLNVRDNAVVPDVVPITIVIAPLAPVIKLNTASAAPNDTVTVTGSGYGANEVVDVTLGPIALLSVKADNSGNFSGNFQTPVTVPFGTYNVAGKGESTGALNFAALLITPISPFAPTSTVTGTPTATGTPLPPPPTPTVTPVPQGPTMANFYFAEGTTAPGTIENLDMLNPAPIAAHVSLNLVFPDGTVKGARYLVPAGSFFVVNVNGLVGNEIGNPVSVQVTGDQKISVARSIVRPGKDGTLSDGTSAITHFIYFAEGYTGRGFQESLAMFNPSNANGSVVVKLLPSNGAAPIVKTFVIGPIRRYTFNVNEAAPRMSVGAEIISDAELSVERTLTFGANGHGQTTVPGVSAPRPTWYFAEGSTKNGFGEFITLLNPATVPAPVTVRFYDPSGRQIGVWSRVVAPSTRATINVGTIVRATSVGAIVSSVVPILAERSLYRGSLTGPAVVGSGTFGRADLSSAYDFPSGDTSPGQSEFLLLLNPNPTPLTVFATFYPLTGPSVPYTIIVPAHARVTVNAGRSVPNLPHGQHGVTLLSSDGRTFVAEQSLYGPSFSSASVTLGVAEATPTP